MAERPRVVIVGAGFGGLWTARALASAPVQGLLVDRNNYHTFLPLTYQVAGAELSPDETVTPVRRVLRKLPNFRFAMTEVSRVDLPRQIVVCQDREIPYDSLVLAPGSTPHFFGIPGAEEYAFSLRTLEDGVVLRNHILSCFERATTEPDPERRRCLLTFTIVGGGPTGVEFAGALAELIYGPLQKDFPDLDFREVRILQLEAMDNLLPGMAEHLGRYSRERLRVKGVEVRVKAVVGEITPGVVYLKDKEPLSTETVVWTAGHRGHPLAEASGMPTNRRGQVMVQATLQVPGYPNVYVVGDLASVAQEGKPVPMVAPAAMQQGEQAARNILRQMSGREPEPFSYRDPGMMVVVGRNAAVASIGKRSFSGFPAWVLWLGVHLVKLIGFGTGFRCCSIGAGTIYSTNGRYV